MSSGRSTRSGGGAGRADHIEKKNKKGIGEGKENEAGGRVRWQCQFCSDARSMEKRRYQGKARFGVAGIREKKTTEEKESKKIQKKEENAGNRA